MCKPEASTLDQTHIYTVHIEGRKPLIEIEEAIIRRVKAHEKIFDFTVLLTHTDRQNLSNRLFYNHKIYVRFQNMEQKTLIVVRKLTDKEQKVRNKKSKSKRRRSQ